MSHPLRDPLVRASARGAFRGIYVVVSLITFGADDLFLSRDRTRAAAVGSRASGVDRREPADVVRARSCSSARSSRIQPSQARRAEGRPTGVFAITRHPMMWSFAIWAIVHLAVVAMPKALVFDGAILLLALGGAAAQDRKKAQADGRGVARMDRPDGVRSLHRRSRLPGNGRAGRRDHFLLPVTWCHPIPAGFWRWIG